MRAVLPWKRMAGRMVLQRPLFRQTGRGADRQDNLGRKMS